MANDLILVVEADAKSRSVLELSLKKAGHRVQLVERGRDALEWLEDQDASPSLIISGVELPGMTGFEFCRRVKENLDWEPVPFIFLTDTGSMDSRRQGFELGVEDFLTRPIYVKEITTRVQMLLQRREKELLAEAGAEAQSGSLDDVTLIDLLQAIEGRGRTGIVEIARGTRRGVFYFREGQVIDAAAGKLAGAEAIYRMMLWPQGTYSVRYIDDIRRRDRINMSTQDVLIEGMKQLDQWEGVRGQGPGLDRIFEVNYRQLADHLRDLPDEVNAVIRLFDGFRTTQDVIDDSMLGAAGTLQVIGKLQGQGLIHDVTPEKGDADSLGELDSKASLDDWLGMEAGETVEAKPGRRAAAETEAETVRRRREDRKRRKLESRRRTGSFTTLRARAAEAPQAERLASDASVDLSSAPDEGSTEDARLRAEIEAIESRSRGLKEEADALLKAREARQRSRQEAAEPQLARAVSPETERLRARLVEAEAEAGRLARERAAIEAEMERQAAERVAAKAARAAVERAAVEAARVAAERQAAEAARVAAERVAAEAARVAAERAAAEAARLEAERRAAEAARVEAERAAAERVAIEAARLEAERVAVEVARAEAARQAEEAALDQARRELEEAQRRAAEESARLEALKRDRDLLAAQSLAAESARLDAERAAAEVERLKIEREIAEAARAASLSTAEAARQEIERKAVEAARIEADRVEAERVEAEAARVEAERVAAEAARVEVEGAAAEAARVEVEGAATQEVERVAAKATDDQARRKVEEEAARLDAERRAANKARREEDLKQASESAVPPPPPPKVPATARTTASGELPALKAPSSLEKSPLDSGTSGTTGGRVERTTSPALKTAQDSFFESEPEYYPEPVESKNNTTTIAALIVVGLIVVVVGVVLYNNNKADQPISQPIPGAGPDKPAPAMSAADAGSVAPAALAAAPSSADAGAEPSIEAFVEARDKASDAIWNVALMGSVYHPETGLSLLAPAAAAEESGEEKPEEVVNQGVNTPPDPNKVPKEARNVPDKGVRDPAPVKEAPVNIKGDSAIDSMSDGAKRREVEKLLKEAQRLMNGGKHDEALVKLGEANVLAPGSGQIARLQGIGYHNSGKSKQAVPYLERSVRSNGSDANTVRILGDAYMATGDRTKAVETYQKFLVLQPTGAISDQVREIVARHR